MPHQSFHHWLRDGSPDVPGPFLPYLLREGEGPADPRTLLEWGMAALGRAVEGKGREAAFDLLVADALLTYACEAAAGARDVGIELEEFLRLLGARFG